MSDMNVMVDLETLGVGPEAAILSIGACKFDPESSSIDSSFYVAIDPVSAIGMGLKVDGSTLLWWLHPDRAEARDAYLSSERWDLPSALDGFASWFGADSLPLWGNGATFDNVILRNAFRTCGLEAPWKYWDDRCFRTVKATSGSVNPVTVIGTKHHALDDAIAQARWLQDLRRGS